MKDYKRLTERDEFGNADIIGLDSNELACALDFDGLNKLTFALNKLASLEEKIESGEVCDGEELEQIKKARDEYKHRAEVAERALKKLASFFAHNAKFLKDEREKERYQKTIFDDWTNQAEEELAEEGKDD